jgi:ABC-2 type transport system ATP-binding protein
VQAQIGYMSQGFSLYDRLTIAENLAFAADIRDVPPEAFAARKAELLRMAELERFEARREGALSAGEVLGLLGPNGAGKTTRFW